MGADLDQTHRRLELVEAHLESALTEEEPAEKNYHIREALQLIGFLEEDR